MLDDDDDDDDAKNAISRPSLPAAIETHRVYRLLYRPRYTRLYRQRTIDILSTEAILASNDEKTGHTTKKTFPILPGWQKKFANWKHFHKSQLLLIFTFQSKMAGTFTGH